MNLNANFNRTGCIRPLDVHNGAVCVGTVDPCLGKLAHGNARAPDDSCVTVAAGDRRADHTASTGHEKLVRLVRGLSKVLVAAATLLPGMVGALQTRQSSGNK
jgi:hypothetical protein